MAGVWIELSPASSHFVLIQSCTFSPWESVISIHEFFPDQVIIFLETSSLTYPEVCLLGNSKSYQVEIKADHPAANMGFEARHICAQKRQGREQMSYQPSLKISLTVTDVLRICAPHRTIPLSQLSQSDVVSMCYLMKFTWEWFWFNGVGYTQLSVTALEALAPSHQIARS